MRFRPALIYRRYLRRLRAISAPTTTRSFSATISNTGIEKLTRSSKVDASTTESVSLSSIADVPWLQTDDDAINHLSVILGRQLLLSTTRLSAKDRDDNYDVNSLSLSNSRNPVVIDPGPGVLTRHLLEQNPRLHLRGVQRSLTKYPCNDILDGFFDRFEAQEGDFWTALLPEEMPDTIVELERIFYGEMEATRMEENRLKRRYGSNNGDDGGEHDDSPQSRGVTLFAPLQNSVVGRVIDRFIDVGLDPEIALLSPFVKSSTFFFLVPSNFAPIDVGSVFGRLPKIESKERGENLVLVTSKRFVSSDNKPQNRVRTTLMNCFYDVTPLAAVCPRIVHTAVFGSPKKAVVKFPYLLIRWSPKKETSIPVAATHRRSFGLFVNMLGGCMNKRVIPSVETFLPDLGPNLIMDGYFTMAETVKELSFERTLKLFRFLTESPLYAESIFGLVESGQLNTDEWLKKRLKIKKGFVKASFVD